MKKVILSLLLACLSLSALAQNTGYGSEDEDYASLIERIAKLEKKTDAFNLYLNFAGSYQLTGQNNSWSSAFRAKDLRLEIKGRFGKHLSYRFRHKLNSIQEGGTWEKFSKATDILMVSWKFNDMFTVMGGKFCQFWGGFEYDEVPMYIYEYSDILNNMDCFLAGAAFSFTPWKGQEFVVNVSNSYSFKMDREYPLGKLVDGTPIVASKHPFAYIFNWNGHFFDNKLLTRWGGGAYCQAEGFWDKLAFLGTKLNLSRFQVYFDWMSAWEGLDREKIASSELAGEQGYLTNVHYNSFVLKANWQFAPKWNLMAKGMYETTTVPGLKNYRTALGYLGAVEFYPLKDQDLRVFLAYVGRNYRYTAEASAAYPALVNNAVNRFEVGIMYNIKIY